MQARRRIKIPNSELDCIIHRLNTGESFTSVANDYGVKAWTIQKRLKLYHPVGGRNTSHTWLILDDYLIAVKLVAERYQSIDVNMYDIVLDYAYRLTKHEMSVIRSARSPFWRFHDILRAKVYNCEIKKRQRIAGVKCSFTAVKTLSTIVDYKYTLWD